MKLQDNTVALDFNAITSERGPFIFNRLQGNKILLSFLRYGSCPLSNYRIQQLKRYKKEFVAKGLTVVCVFESMPRDIFPFTGRAEDPFYILADPMALLYDLYSVETSEKKVRNILASGIVAETFANAEKEGFALMPQEGSDFFRMPADFLIDEDLIIRKAHYSDMLIDHLPVHVITEWLDNGNIFSGSRRLQKVS